MIRKTFSYFDEDMIKVLYTTYVRPRLEFVIPAWSPYLIGDIAKIERVPKRATKIVYRLKRLK